MENPCKDCQRKGCGSYHDICPEHIAWKKEDAEKKKAIKEAKRYQGRDYIKQSSFKHRTHGAFKCAKKERK